ncbi:MAG: hypothetical protein DIU84_00060 [Bacillota bacterium]|nr:MAG: hypothetical protein DIU84_00060 [Bacillota bacterium]
MGSAMRHRRPWWKRVLGAGLAAGMVAAWTLAGTSSGFAATASNGVRVETVQLLAGTRHATPMTVIRAEQDGPVVLAVGGVHGDKPAGVEAGKVLAEFRDLERGTLIVIPALNRQAVEAGRRSVDIDLNRAFPTSSRSQPSDPRARAVWDVMQAYGVDYLIDMHEDARPWTSSGLGRVLVYRRVGDNQATAQALKAALDKTSSRSWRLGGEPIVTGLVRSAQDVLGVSAFYVSTSRTDAMSLRVQQHVTAVMTLLERLGMVKGGSGGGTPSNTVTVRTILSGTVHATKLYVIDSGVPGPTVWISGGVHGSELAGWMAAERITQWRVSRGRLIVVPHAFELAVQQRLRAARGYSDLNRQFPTSASGSPSGTLAKGLWEELKRYRPDWVFDLHEAMSNRNLNPSSVGQTIIVYPNSEINALVQTVISRINRNLSSTLHFQMLRYPVQGSLARAAGQFLGANAAIVETSRLYDLDDRIDWHLTIMRYVLEELDMGPVTHTSSLSGSQAAAA